MIKNINTALSVSDRSGRQTISNDIDDLNSLMNQFDLIDISRKI